ncbi:unnamed protein product, partial [Cylicocyclus nassatus]
NQPPFVCCLKHFKNLCHPLRLPRPHEVVLVSSVPGSLDVFKGPPNYCTVITIQSVIDRSTAICRQSSYQPLRTTIHNRSIYILLLFRLDSTDKKSSYR